MRKMMKNESGQSIILISIALVLLLSFAAIVIDLGAVVLKKAKLQSAIDAAALAGAQSLPDTAAATAAAQSYVVKNGFSASDIQVAFAESNTRINVTATKDIPYTFAQVLGLSSATVENLASAKREAVSGGGGASGIGGEYILFSESDNGSITFTGSGGNVQGNIHSNYKVSFGNPTIITGRCEAVKGFVSPEKATIGTSIPNAQRIAIGNSYEFPADAPSPPSAPQGAVFKSQSAWGVPEWYNGTYVIDKPIYVSGNFNFGSSVSLKITGNGCIYATGDIDLAKGGNNVIIDTNNSIAIRSETGSVKIPSLNMTGGSGCIVAYTWVNIMQSPAMIKTSNSIAVMSQTSTVTILQPTITGGGSVIARDKVDFDGNACSMDVENRIAVLSTNGGFEGCNVVLKGKGGIFTSGEIKCTGYSVNVTSSACPTMYSANGNILLENTSTVAGLYFAPKGTIKPSGSSCTLKGSFVAYCINLGNTFYGYPLPEGVATGGGTTTYKYKLVQ